MLKIFKKKHLPIVAAGLAGLWMAADASAALNGPYLGGQLGWSNVHQGNSASKDVIEIEPGSSFVVDSRTSDRGLAGRIFAGYQFNSYFALETGYTRFHNATGKASITETGFTDSWAYNETIKTDAVDLVGKGIMPLQNGFNVYGKLGAAYLRAQGAANLTENESGQITSYRISDNAHKVYPTFGLGAGYDLTQNLSADLSWNHIQKVGSSSLPNTDLFALGLAYHFG